MKSQEILYHSDGYAVVFRPPECASDVVNNIDILEEATGICWNIKSLTKDALGNCTDDLYTAVQVKDGLIYVSTFRGLKLTIDIKQHCIIEKKVSK